MDDNIKQYYPEGVTQSEADELFKKEWTRDFAYRVKLQEEGMESIAGYGTTKHSFRIIVEELPKLFKELEIKTMLDAACGDYYGMVDVDFTDVNYIGIDMVTAQIQLNKEKYPNVDFRNINMVTDELPSGDLVFARDVLVHTSSSNIKRFLKNCKDAGYKYLLTTTFPEVDNQELGGVLGWRMLNFDKEPWGFTPIQIISEQHDMNPEKCLGLYSIEDISDKLGL
jgi:hypothetical protein